VRILALDVGTKTIGVAVSDPLGMFAQPVETIRRVGRRKDVERVVAHVLERQVGCVVVGLPLKTDGSEGPSAAEARRMLTALDEALDGVEIVLHDERFTTQQAERALVGGGVRRKKRKQLIDQVAAVLILQAYLDSRGVR